SPRFAEMLGYESHELPPTLETWKSHIHPDDLEAAEAAFDAHLKSDVPYDIEYRMRIKSGEYLWYRSRAKSLRDDSGKAYRTSGTIGDINERKNAENKLMESQERVELALKGGNLGFWDVDLNSGKTIVNDRYREIFGFTDQGETTHRESWLGAIHPDDQEHVTTIGRKYRNNEIDSYEVQYRAIVAGEERWLVSRGTAVEFNEDGTISRMVGTMADFTNRKHMEDKIIATERRFRALLASAPDPLVVVDSNGVITMVNNKTEILTGYISKTLVGKKIEFLIPNAAQKQNIEMRTNFIKNPTSHPNGASKELTIKTRDGNLVPVEVSLSPIETDEGLMIASSLRDISDRLEAERKIKESEERLDMALKGASAGLWDWSSTTGELITGDIWSTMLGYNKKELDDKYGNRIERFTNLVHPDDLAETMEELQRHINGETDIYKKEFRMLTKDGEWKWILDIGQASERDHDGKGTRLVGVHLDIDEAKDMQREILHAKEIAEDATRAKSDFLANMSHEIRTPMNAIIGMSHLALQTELTKKQKDYIDKIHTAANSLLGIINDILDFSKIEAEKMEMEEIPFSLSNALDNLANLVTVKTQEKGLELLIATDPNTPEGLVGDPLRLGQILINLVNNAVKFTDSGEIVVRIKMLETQNDRVILQFSVRDSGIGMTEDQVKKLFQSFSQADASTTRKYGGTGLGLTISKKLTEMMGGKIWVESKYGEGSSFIFTANFGTSKEAEHKITMPEPNLRELPVLMVDDSPTAREIMQQLAESLSFKVKLAASGEEALEKIQLAEESGLPFKVVFMDWKMQGIDGVETRRRIASHTTLKHQPKVVMVTAYDRSEMMRNLNGLEVDGILAKPISASSLMDATMVAMGYGEMQSSQTVAGDLGLDLVKWIMGAKVLLVEDNEVNQQVACELLEMAKLVVTVAENGQIAVDKVKTGSFDLVLMDIQMPVMDGYTASNEIRKETAFSDLPIIAMTANAMAGDREKCLAAGMNDHVVKPINPNDMFATLAKWVKPGTREVPLELQQQQLASKGRDDDPPLELPGFDLKGAILRMGGNTKAYKKTLGKVLEAEADAMERIGQSLDSGDSEAAVRGAHTLKGVAGNIGALELQKLAAKLEMALMQDGEARPEALITEVEQCLNLTLATIKNGLQSEQTATKPANIDPAQIIFILDKLQEQVDNFDSSASTTCEELTQQLQGSKLTSIVGKLGKALDTYEFDQAQELIKEIKEKLD
ncbi:MAG: PAS domain-containing protein, partial [Magnetococcales bacterium]|nr:PAS domain-containing protein [Magnetococcales bacterium]